MDRAGYDHFYTLMSQYTRSQVGFLRKSHLSFLPPFFLSSLSSQYLPSEGLVFSVSPLYRESLVDDSLKTLPTEQRKQARRLTAMVRTHVHNSNKHTLAHAVDAESLHQLSCGWQSGERRRWMWYLKSRNSNYFSRRIKVSRCDNSSELCSFDTGDISGGETIKTTQREGEED